MQPYNPKDGTFEHQHPAFPSKADFEPTLDFFGTEIPRCQAWRSNRSAQCGKPALKGVSLCAFHSGRTHQQLAEMRSRKQFQEALAEYIDEDGDLLISVEAVRQLGKHVRLGNLTAIKTWIEHQFGAPTTTTVMVVDPEVMMSLGTILGDYIKDRGDLEECLRRLSEAVASR